MQILDCNEIVTMTTFSTQKQIPEVARAEERLQNILTVIGRTRIPELEVGDFYEDLEKTSGGGDDKLEQWEEQVGVRLGLRILDNIMLEQFNRQEELQLLIDDITREKVNLEKEIKVLKADLLQAKQMNSKSIDVKSDSNEIKILKKENLKWKEKFSNLVQQYDQLANELKIDQNSKKIDSQHLDVEENACKEANRKRKSPSSVVEIEKKLDKAMIDSTPKSKRLFSRSRNPQSSNSHSTQAHLDDKSFVPDTLQIVNNQDTSNKRTLPVPRSSNNKDVDMEISIPDTPERSQLHPSNNIEVCVTPEKIMAGSIKIRNGPVSPLIARGTYLPNNKKMRIFHREEVLRESNIKTMDCKTARKLAKKNKKSLEEIPDSLAVTGDKENGKKVGKIAPSAQSEIDKKSFNDLDQDFPMEKVEKTSPKKVKNNYFPSDTDSDFESPNLLAKNKRNHKSLRNKENLDKKKDGQENLKKPTKVSTKTQEEIDDIFDSPAEAPEATSKPAKVRRTTSKVENRWGVVKESMDDLSESDKKRFTGSKQANIVGFFKNPPKKPSSDFVRVCHADTDMEAAIALSVQAAQAGNNKEEGKDDKIVGDEHEVLEVMDTDDEGIPKPAFAHIGPTVRKKEERKKLYGFDCRECQEYYQQKLEEGLSKDQIMKILNKCSRHRGLFKPPLTPEKFWDADIIEDDPDDPRIKTQPGQVLRTRAVRRAEARSKKRELLEKS